MGASRFSIVIAASLIGPRRPLVRIHALLRERTETFPIAAMPLPMDTASHAPWRRGAEARMKQAMKRAMNGERLRAENRQHAQGGGRSQANAGHGFRPAFLDFATQTVYLSRFADGALAPFHLLDGLPEHLVVDRAPSGRVIAAKSTLLSGFERNGFFYTRKAAARAVADWG
jgi:hypothetical protein